MILFEVGLLFLGLILIGTGKAKWRRVGMALVVPLPLCFGAGLLAGVLGVLNEGRSFRIGEEQKSLIIFMELAIVFGFVFLAVCLSFASPPARGNARVGKCTACFFLNAPNDAKCFKCGRLLA